MNGHQWRIKRLLAWSIPGLCLLLLILYFVGVTLHISPKYDALEAEYKKLNLPSDWVELKQYRQETRDVFGWCQNFTEGPACPGLVTKYRVVSLPGDPRGTFENVLNQAEFTSVKSSSNCEVENKTNTTGTGFCDSVARNGSYVVGLSVQKDFIGLLNDVIVELSYVWVEGK